jgi:hypothetical protein
MKTTKSLSKVFLIGTLMFLLSVPASIISAAPAKQMYYEINIYRINSSAQASVADKYLKEAFIPAMHRAGISKIGVFKPVETDTAFGKFIYVFIPYKNYDQFFKMEGILAADKVYQQAGKDFLDAPYNNPPFVRYESVFLKAFPLMPEFKVPSFTTPPGDRIYELRSYESATEAKATKKIQMFNEGGEIAIFQKIGANAVFYAQVLLGSQKPRLMYMTTYANMKAHDDCWAAFRATSEWKTLSAMEEYKNTVSKAKPFLLHPTEYSDF